MIISMKYCVAFLNQYIILHLYIFCVLTGNSASSSTVGGIVGGVISFTVLCIIIIAFLLYAYMWVRKQKSEN